MRGVSIQGFLALGGGYEPMADELLWILESDEILKGSSRLVIRSLLVVYTLSRYLTHSW